MAPILAELDSIKTEGMALLAGLPVEPTQLQAWLRERDSVFSSLAAKLNLTDNERASAAQLIGEILALDVRLLSTLQERLGMIGGKILNARRVHHAMGASARSHAPVLFQRAV